MGKMPAGLKAYWEKKRKGEKSEKPAAKNAKGRKGGSRRKK